MASTTPPLPASLTHQHLFASLNTLLAADADTVRILDAGCGDGRLMSFVYRALKWARPEINIELHGFDVVDHGVQLDGFLDKTIATLSSDIPAIPWSEQIRAQYVTDKWGFADGYFDFVLSNQVLEHVHDKGFFFSESHRVLRDGGYAIHLAPLVHYILEGHLYLPWVHRIRSHDLLLSYISFLSGLGMGKFRAHNKLTGVSRADFSRRHADYVYFWTNYASESEILDLARNNKLRASFRFSSEFYSAKLRQILRLPLKGSYASNRSALLDSIAIKALRYLSCVTLVCEKRNSYREN